MGNFMSGFFLAIVVAVCTFDVYRVSAITEGIESVVKACADGGRYSTQGGVVLCHFAAVQEQDDDSF